MVRLFTIVCLVFGFHAAWGDNINNPASCNCDSANNNLFKAQTATPRNESLIKDWQARADKCQQGCMQKSDGGCSSASSDFDKADQDMATACGETGLGDCPAAFAECSKADITGSHYKPSRSSKSSSGIDVSAEAKRMNACPALSGEGLDKLNEDLQKSKDKIKDMEEAAGTKSDDLNKVKSNADEKIADLNKQLTDATNAHTKALAEIRKQQRADQKSIMDNLNQIQTEVDKLHDQIRQTNVAKSAAMAKYVDTKTQIDINCQAQASAQVAKMQMDVLPLMKMNSYNRGGFIAVLNNVGVSSRAQWQRVAQKYYNWCEQSMPTAKSKESANNAYKVQMEAQDANIMGLNDQIASKAVQMKTLVSNVPCGQQTPAANGMMAGGQTQACQSALDANEALQQENQTYAANQNNIQQQITKANENAAQEWASKQRVAAQAAQDLEDEKKRQANLQAYLDAKYAAGAHSNTDEKKFSAAYQAFIRAVHIANLVVNCKNKDAGIAVNTRPPSSECLNDPPCQKAADFLSMAGSAAKADNALRSDGDSRSHAEDP